MTKALTFTSKGSLTGEEVGRIFIRDYARFIKAIQDDKNPPKDKFTDAEKQEMVNSLTEAYEIRQYNIYVGIVPVSYTHLTLPTNREV